MYPGEKQSGVGFNMYIHPHVLEEDYWNVEFVHTGQRKSILSTSGSCLIFPLDINDDKHFRLFLLVNLHS